MLPSPLYCIEAVTQCSLDKKYPPDTYMPGGHHLIY